MWSSETSAARLSTCRSEVNQDREAFHHMNTSKLIFAAVFCSLRLAAHSAETYKIDAVHSSVLFSIKHLGVTDFYGGFNEVAGAVSFDSAAPSKSSVQLTVPVESLATRNPKRDQHLKSPDFFN